jgi:hypothetical protein
MEKSLRSVQQRLLKDQISTVLEVRDARIPLSCINWRFERLLAARHHSIFRGPGGRLTAQYRDGWGQSVGASVDRLSRFIVYNKVFIPLFDCYINISYIKSTIKLSFF